MSLWWLILVALIIIFCVMQWVERPVRYYSPATLKKSGGLAYRYNSNEGIEMVGNDGYRYHLASPADCDYACQSASVLPVQSPEPSYPPRWFY